MKKEIKLPTQSESKSVLDVTPFELSQIDDFQNHNRGFIDNEDEYLESWFNWED